MNGVFALLIAGTIPLRAATIAPQPFTLVTETLLQLSPGLATPRTVVYPGTTSDGGSNGAVFATGSSWSGLAEARTEPDPPSAIALTRSTSNGFEQSTGAILGGGYPSYASAALEYDYYLEQTATPPVSLPPSLAFPVVIDAMVDAFATISGASFSNAAFARAYLVIGNYSSPRAVAHAPDRSFARDTHRVSYGTSLEIGQVLDVLLFAEARSVASAGPDPPINVFSHAMAIADPVIQFDQAAFDQIAIMHGFETFDLNDYFAIRYSPGVGPGAVSAIPEPGPAAMVLLALGTLAVFARSKHR